MKVRWSSDAEDDRDDIWDCLASRNPHAAFRVDQAITEAVARLVEFPQSGRPGLLPNTRETFAYRHYRIVYTIDDDAVWIEAVLHTSRQWPPGSETPDDEAM